MGSVCVVTEPAFSIFSAYTSKLTAGLKHNQLSQNNGGKKAGLEKVFLETITE